MARPVDRSAQWDPAQSDVRWRLRLWSEPTRKVISNGEIRERPTRLPIDEWPVRIDAAHPGYISWETFVSNEQRLRENTPRMHGATTGAPKNGRALLAGIVLCGRCRRRMRVDYKTSERTYW